jgi:dienelactone hydrolase
VARFARQIAGQGYICVAPSSYHEFTGPEPLKYDAEDTDKGNAWKIGKVSRLHVLNAYLHIILNRFCSPIVLISDADHIYLSEIGSL